MSSLNAWEQYKQNLGNTRPWDLVNPNTKWVSGEISAKRFEICKACPEFIQGTARCKKCGCFMKAKTKLENATCPLSKWDNE